MSRFIAILLLICYTACTVVTDVSFHYCGKKLKYVSLKKEEKNSCCKGKMKRHKCCNDKVVSLDIDDHHKYFAGATLTLSKVFAAATIPYTPAFFINTYTAPDDIIRVSHSPPLLRNGTVSLNILHCVYLI